MRRILFILIMLMLSAASHAQLNWTKVLNNSLRVSVIYFIDKDVGFVANGTVPGGSAQTTRVYRTADGGNTWNQVTLSGLSSYGIQDFYFDDAQVGYAIGASGSSKLWKTTDGGLTWQKRNATGLSTPLTIRRSSNGLVSTDFFNELLISTDDGDTFTKRKTGSVNESHLGLDFVDSLHGVVDGNYRQSTTSWYYTEDGGTTWKPNGTKMETWSMYGQKGTPNFFACPEGYSTGPTYFSDVYRSTNYGKTFSTIYRFPYQMSGHVAGAGNAIYVLSSAAGSATAGVYRSTDLGATWVHLGGSNTIADTRFFVVPQCGGNIIFFADPSGAVYRATDNVGTGSSGGTQTKTCLATYTVTPAASPGNMIQVPIDYTMGSDPIIGTIVDEATYVIEFSTLAVDTLKFKTSDIAPATGWSRKSAVMKGDSLVVVLTNTGSVPLSTDGELGSVKLYLLSGSPLTHTGVILRSIEYRTNCATYFVEPTIEQSTLTRLEVTSSAVASERVAHTSLLLYPNPAHNQITLRSELLSKGACTICVYDLRGAILLEKHVNENTNEHTISTTSLPAGRYTLQLFVDDMPRARTSFVIE